MSENMLENAVCFVLRISALGNSRKVNTAAVECDADKTMIGVNKRLFDSEEYKAIKKQHGEIRQFVYSRSVPAFFLRDGVYMLKASEVQNVIADLEPMIRKSGELADDFVAVYPALIRDAETRLRSLFNPGDYLSADVARAQFAVSYQFIEFGVPGTLRAVSPELFEQESAKLRDTFSNAAESIVQLLYSETAGLLDHALDRLEGNGDSKPKVFRDSLVNNLKEFAAGLKSRNITDNEGLNDLADRLQAMLSNVSPEYLRNSETLRSRIVTGFREVKTVIDAAMIERPSRRIDLSED